MSGGLGPCNDIGLTKEEERPTGEIHAQQHPRPLMSSPSPTAHHRHFSFRQLNALAVIVVLLSSGMVSLDDFAFAIFSLYILFLAKAVFPSLTPAHEPSVLGERNHSLYVLAGFIVGMLLPIVYIFEVILEGDKEGIKAATPHVFLLASQVFIEGLVLYGHFSLPIPAFVPVFYNAKRLPAIMDWLWAEVGKVEVEHGSTRRLHVGRGLAVANLVFWSFNLFGLLIPVYLPRSFKRYCGQKEKA